MSFGWSDSVQECLEPPFAVATAPVHRHRLDARIHVARERRAVPGLGEGEMTGHRAGQGASPADRETTPPQWLSLPPDYIARILRLEALPDNTPGADKSWVHRAHADAVRHLSSAKRR